MKREDDAVVNRRRGEGILSEGAVKGTRRRRVLLEPWEVNEQLLIRMRGS